MGVSGSGKTTVGAALAAALGIEFVEGDDYHPPDNVRSMAAGIPLTDADRAGWLSVLAARLTQARDSGTAIVMSCSALKRAYRDVLRTGGDPQFIHLTGPRLLLSERLAARQGHYMPASLLDSQLATLEEPAPDENAWVCDISQTPEEIVNLLRERVAP
jgi:gluconokinase